MLAATTDLLAVGVGDVEAGGDGVVEVDVPVPGRGDEALQVVRLLHRVQLPPVRAVLAVVLGRVQVAAQIVTIQGNEVTNMTNLDMPQDSILSNRSFLCARVQGRP